MYINSSIVYLSIAVRASIKTQIQPPRKKIICHTFKNFINVQQINQVNFYKQPTRFRREGLNLGNQIYMKDRKNTKNI